MLLHDIVCLQINFKICCAIRSQCQLQTLMTPDVAVSTRQPRTPTTVPRCQLQSLTTPVPPSIADPDWSDQDLAVLSLLFGPLWRKAKECEVSSRPQQFKSAGMRKLMKNIWQKTCALKLKDGKFTTRKGIKIEFDGGTLLKLVTKYRVNPKNRNRFCGRIQHATKLHYDSLPKLYQPHYKNMPLHEYWEKIRKVVGPPDLSRVKLMRQAKTAAAASIADATTSEPLQETPELSPLQERLNTAVQAIVE